MNKEKEQTISSANFFNTDDAKEKVEKKIEKEVIAQTKLQKNISKTLLGDGIIDTDKLKGNYKSDEEKAKTKKKNEAYVRQYVKSNYSRYTIYLNPQEKNEVLVQSELKGQTISAYIKSLIKADKENFNPDEYVKRMEQVVKSAGEDSNAGINQKETRQIKMEQARKEAEEFFGMDPKLVPKAERCRFIDKRLNEEKAGKGLIQIYCNALYVSRTMYYNSVKNKKRK